MKTKLLLALLLMGVAPVVTLTIIDLTTQVTGVLPQANGGLGAASLTCTAGDFVTCSGSACSCSTPSGGGGAPVGATYITQTADGTLTNEQALSSLSTGLVSVTTGTGVLSNYAGSSCAADRYATSTSGAGALTCSQVSVAGINATGTPSATTYLRGDGTWSTVSGSGSPGGSTTQVQYNNAGAFGGTSAVTTDGTDLIFTGNTAHPTAPGAGKSILRFYELHGANAPGMPQALTPELNFDMSIDPWVKHRSDEAVWGCVQPAAWNAVTITPSGVGAAGSATGTAAAVAWASTDERTRSMWVQYPSAATASSSAGLRANVDNVWLGNAANLGGFYWTGSFNVVTTTANQRLFVGLKDATAVITATANPSAQLDIVGFWCDAGQTTIRIGSNDNAGSSSNAVDLGANFPCTTANIAYDVALWASANGTAINYHIRRLVGGNEATGTINTDLPRNTVQLGWDFWINNGGTAAASTIQFGGTCWWANP